MPSNTVKTSYDCALGLLISTCITHIVTNKLCDLSKLTHLGISATSLSKMLQCVSPGQETTSKSITLVVGDNLQPASLAFSRLLEY